MCVTILTITVYEKFSEGGWVTLLITSAAIGLCYLVKHHYETVKRSIRELDDILMGIPANETAEHGPPRPAARRRPSSSPRPSTASASIPFFRSSAIFPTSTRTSSSCPWRRSTPGSFKGAAEVQALRDATKHALEKYVKVTRRHGFPADYRMETATDVPTDGGRPVQVHRARVSPRRPSLRASSCFTGRPWSTRSSTTRRPSPSSAASSGRAYRP